MLPNLPKRTVVVAIRVTPGEREAIIAAAQRAGRSVSNYIRRRVLHDATPIAQPSAQRIPSRILSSAAGDEGA